MPNQSAPPVRAADESPGLLLRRLIFGDPERSIVRMSPDGMRIAFRAPVDGVLNLWIAPIDRIGDARPVTAVTDRNLGPWIVWMRDNRHVVFFREAAGDENWPGRWRVARGRKALARAYHPASIKEGKVEGQQPALVNLTMPSAPIAARLAIGAPQRGMPTCGAAGPRRPRWRSCPS